MRQRVGEKKTRAIRKKTGLPVVKVYVRGGTNHRKDLHLEDGTVVHLYKDGTMKNTAEFTFDDVAMLFAGNRQACVAVAKAIQNVLC